jgi:hypothetical protein
MAALDTTTDGLVMLKKADMPRRRRPGNLLKTASAAPRP